MKLTALPPRAYESPLGRGAVRQECSADSSFVKLKHEESMQRPSRSHQESQFVYRLAACLAASHEAFEGFCASLDRGVSYESQAVPAEERSSWLNFVEEKVFPLNIVTARLIDEHRHLWEELPPELADFMEYHTSWLARHTAWKANPMQPYTFRADRSFPLSVNAWVLQQLRDLMRSVTGSRQRQELVL
jgi:hypothetical protein